MAEIAAATVMKLRKMSGQGMMDCKKALEQSGGDLDAAMEVLRKKGLATMAKRAGRDTSEGKVLCVMNDDRKNAAIASLCCETDFVAKSEDFDNLAKLTKIAMSACSADSGAEQLSETEAEGKKISEHITDTVAKTGEKTEIGDFCRFSVQGEGVIGCYVHFNDKIGAMVRIETSDQDTAGKVTEVANEICMHISAINPMALDRDSVDPDLVAKERDAAAEQVKNKPAEIIDKIVDGKMGKFFAENCLVDQKFVKDDSKTVGQALKEAAGSGQAKMTNFVRVEIA